MLTGLGARVHIFVPPSQRQQFTGLWRDVLKCDVRELDFGLPHPIVLVSFPDGSAFSVEFDERAAALAFCTTWIEFRTEDLAGVHEALDRAGIPNFSHPASMHRYFTAPGGQVFRILDIAYRGP